MLDFSIERAQFINRACSVCQSSVLSLISRLQINEKSSTEKKCSLFIFQVFFADVPLSSRSRCSLSTSVQGLYIPTA